MSSDHAAQNLRTTSIGLSIWLLLQSSFGQRPRGLCVAPRLDAATAPPALPRPRRRGRSRVRALAEVFHPGSLDAGILRGRRDQAPEIGNSRIRALL